MALGKLREGVGDSADEVWMGILHAPPSAVYLDSTNVPISLVGLTLDTSGEVLVRAARSRESLTWLERLKFNCRAVFQVNPWFLTDRTAKSLAPI